MNELRALRADEIEIRAQTVRQKGFVALLYKDARCDMNILDESFGITGWQREHTVVNGNLFCTVSIWDSEKQQWIKKQDVGTESFTEKEKGQASDSFKRACTNLGIGRELYTSPFIWINCNPDEIGTKNGKFYVENSLKLRVSKIEVINHKITNLEIQDQNNKVRYSWSENTKPKQQPKPQQQTSGGDNLITEQQVKMLWSTAGGTKNQNTVKAVLYGFGYSSTKDIKMKDFNNILDTIKQQLGGN